MKKGRISLFISIVLIVLGIAFTCLGVLANLGVIAPRLVDFVSFASIYIGIRPNCIGVAIFGSLLIAISIIVLAFRNRKPYSMFLPFFMLGIYATVAIFLRLCFMEYVPERIFVDFKNDSKSMPLFFLLIIIEVFLTITLLIATEKLDSRWRKKQAILRKKLESEGVLQSKEDETSDRLKARIEKDNKERSRKERKELARIEKAREKEEKKAAKKGLKEKNRASKSYEKELERNERLKEDIADKAESKARKEEERKAYLLSKEEDKRIALSKKEEKRRAKEAKKLEKQKKRDGEPIEKDFELPPGPANPNKPLEFPDFPDVPHFHETEAPKTEYARKRETRVEYEEPARLEKIEDEGSEQEVISQIQMPKPRYDLNAKKYRSGGMLEATLELMNKDLDSPKTNASPIIGYDIDSTPEKGNENEDTDSDLSIEWQSYNPPRATVKEDSFAPSNLPPTHPRYKMFQSLQNAPSNETIERPPVHDEEKKNIAPSSLSPDHPRYRMFQALQSHGGQNAVSSFPSKAFTPEVESKPTQGPEAFVNRSYSQPEPVMKEVEKPIPDYSMAEEKTTPIQREMPNLYEKKVEAQPVDAYSFSSEARPSNVRVEESAPSSVANSQDVSDDIPQQTESLDLTAGIGGLASAEGGYAAIMNRSRKSYTPPPVDLLKDYPDISNDIDEFTRRQGEIIVETYAQQKTNVHLSNIIKGPTVTMYELTLESGTLISRITSREDELNYALGGKHIRILAPIPGKQAVGIEVPNVKTSIVGFKDMIYSLRANEKYMSLRVPMILGKTITGTPIVIDVAKMPHMIIAGTTGSGKSVCINAFINTLIYQKSPADVRLLLVDPKVVELSVYNGIPHLLTPVITDAKKVVKMLNFLVEEMERRYQMLARLSVRNIEGYNQRLKDERIAAEKMPYIVLIMDEFADMMSVVGKDIEIQIARLAAKARAAGIHLILATQRPSADVITGTIKSNLPARIAFAVSSGTNSRVILDSVGAENLLGKGDMLLMDPGAGSNLQRIQGAFLSDPEVEAISRFAKQHGGEPDYLDEAIFEDEDVSSSDGFGDGPIGDEDSDEYLLKEAMGIICEKKSASASYLQRRLKIGYNRAARIIEILEEKGVVGPANGSKPREILKFSLDDLD